MSITPPGPIQNSDGRHLEKSIDLLREEVTRGFENVNKKFEEVVTKSTFDVTIQRLDQKIDAKDALFLTEIKKVDEKIDSKDEAILNEVRNVEAMVKEGSVRTRWIIGIVLTVSTFASGIIFSIINAIS